VKGEEEEEEVNHESWARRAS